MADYYETLGVSKNASEKDLKTAFRKLAAKHHPDAGGDAEKFKEINEAYNTLKDPQKRQMYDQYGTADPQQMGGNPFGGFNFTGNPEDLQDIFGTFFGQGFGQPRRQMRNKDIRLGYKLSFIDVYTGTGATISYKLPSGKTEVIDVKIPPGLKNNDHIQFQNYGDDSIKGAPRGTLIVQVKIPNPTGFVRDGQHLHTEIVCDSLDLILGKNLSITTPEHKKIALNIQPGTNNGVVLNVTGHGVPDVNTKVRGNLYVKVKALTPKLNEQERQKIREIKNGIDLRTK